MLCRKVIAIILLDILNI